MNLFGQAQDATNTRPGGSELPRVPDTASLLGGINNVERGISLLKVAGPASKFQNFSGAIRDAKASTVAMLSAVNAVKDATRIRYADAAWNHLESSLEALNNS